MLGGNMNYNLEWQWFRYVGTQPDERVWKTRTMAVTVVSIQIWRRLLCQFEAAGCQSIVWLRTDGRKTTDFDDDLSVVNSKVAQYSYDKVY